MKNELTLNLRYCPFDEKDELTKYCRSCRHISRLEHIDLGSRSAAKNGLIRVENPEPTTVGELRHMTDELPVSQRSTGTVVKPIPPLRRFWEYLERLVTPDKLEPFFVLLTFITGSAGLIFEKVESAFVLARISWIAAFIFGGYFGLKGGIQKLLERTIDVDLLMILAALGAAAVGAPFEGALLLFLFSLSNVLQDYALDKTKSAIESLVHLRPTTVEVFRAGEWVEIEVEQVHIDEEIRIRPGDRVALDGVVVSGTSSMDESAITGESRPVGKEVGSEVLSGSINGSGSLRVAVSKEAKDSTIARIVSLVEEARANKAKAERFLDRFEQWYTIVVIGGTILAILIPTLLLGEPWAKAFYRAMTIMVAASPCALVISTPAAVLSAIGNGARRGILFKGGVYVEQAATIKAVAFDKTGTLTFGTPLLTERITIDEESQDEILRCVASLEQNSEHAIARTIVAAAEETQIELRDPDEFRSVPGKGIEGVINNRTLRVGTPAFIAENNPEDPVELLGKTEELAKKDRTVVLISEKASSTFRVIGLYGLSDRLRIDTRETIENLRKAGVEHVVMLTGDNHRTAEAIGAEAGVDEIMAELLPDDKLRALESLQEKYGRIAMVGDGVNDAPALARADIGIAMGVRGTDVAMETADIVLMGESLQNVPYLLALSRATRRTLIFNLGLALGLIGLMMVGIFLVDLPLPLAVVGHEGGTVLVSLNGLRLLLFHWK